jgi:acyl dehydratase
LYRISSDDGNPHNIDPEKTGGFPKPILHGLCSLGVTARGITEKYNKKLTSISVRWTSPVYPGETLATKIFRTNDPSTFVYETTTQERENLCLKGKFSF